MLSDNKCAAEMGVMPLLRLLPMIVIAPFCSRSQRYKLAFVYLALYFYKQSQNSVFFVLLPVNLDLWTDLRVFCERFCIFGSGL